MKRMKLSKITPSDINEIGRGFHIEKITDKYDEYFPFSSFEEFLDTIFGGSTFWANIDDLVFFKRCFP